MAALTGEDLARSALAVLDDYLNGLEADARAVAEGPARVLAQRAIELGTQALAGDQLARENLEDLKAQSLMLAGEVAVKFEERTFNTFRVFLLGALQGLLALAAA